jgi:hypothetical protein
MFRHQLMMELAQEQLVEVDPAVEVPVPVMASSQAR